MTLVLLILFNSFLHDFHISRSEINYDTKSKDLQFAIHIFIDDLESNLVKKGNPLLFIGTDKEYKDTDAIMEKYINTNIKVIHNNKNIPLNMIGKEISKDKLAVWCYLECKDITLQKIEKIENQLLLDLYNDQKNIVDFTIDNKKKWFHIFDKNNTSSTIKF